MILFFCFWLILLCLTVCTSPDMSANGWVVFHCAYPLLVLWKFISRRALWDTVHEAQWVWHDWARSNRKNHNFIHSSIDEIEVSSISWLSWIVLLFIGVDVLFEIMVFCGYIELKQICQKYLTLSMGLTSKLEWKILYY